MTDHENKDTKNGSFFNVSFDRPFDEPDSQPQDSQNKSKPEHSFESKWDNFYEKFKNMEREGSQNNSNPTNDPANFQRQDSLKDKDPFANSLHQKNKLKQSLNKFQKLVNDVSQQPNHQNKSYKSAKFADLKQREQQSFISRKPADDQEKQSDDQEKRDHNFPNTSLESKNQSQPDLNLKEARFESDQNNQFASYQYRSQLSSEERANIRRRRIADLEKMDQERELEKNQSENIEMTSKLEENPDKNASLSIEKDQQSKNLSSLNDQDKYIDDDFNLGVPITILKDHLDNDADTKNNSAPKQFEPSHDSESHITETHTVNRKEARNNKKNNTYSLEGLPVQEKLGFSFNIALNVIKQLLIFFILIGAIVGALAGGVGVGYFANLVSDTPPPTKEEMAAKINKLEQQSTLFYASGEPIANVRTDVVRSVTNLDDVSDYIIDGFIATEDEYFKEHPGIVPKAILRAVIETIVSGSGTGGSTLTQQLVKQQLLSNEVTFFRKANEILLALRLENYFTKDEILTAYLNVSPFGRNNNGDNVAGIGKASEGIFGVDPSEVSLNQAAFLVGLPQDPYIYTPYDQSGNLREDLEPGIERMKEVLFRMYREQKISKEEYEKAKNYDITQDFLAKVERPQQRQTYLYQAVMNGAIEKLMLLNIADDGYTWQQVYSDVDWYNEYYFAAEDQLRTGGYKVYSTIDKEIYDQLQASAKAYEDEIGVTYDGVYTDPETGHETYYIEKVQTGLVAIENTTGKVLGFIAGTDFENNQIDHAFGMRRSPGSTIKPLAVYAPAIEHNLINPSTFIPDTAFVEEYDDGTTWEPTNYGNAVSGNLLTARTALLRSDNLPAVRIYDELLKRGVPIIDYLEKMGFNTIDSYTEDDTQNLAFSLGGVTTGPTVFEETSAFTTFANGGNYVDGYYIERIEDSFGNVVFQQNEPSKQVFSEDTNYLILDMLRDTMTQGTGRTARENMVMEGDWIAKTGISENSKDIWVIASTPKITIGSWIGYDSKYYDYTIDVNDGFGLESVRSQIYWARIINDLYEIRPQIFGTDLAFQQPASVIEQNILEKTGTLPGTTTFNGQTYSITAPLKTELFKVSNPAPPLTGNFLFGASEEEQARFWGQVYSREAEQQRQYQQQLEQQQNNQAESQEETSESNEESTAESVDNNEPTPPVDGGEVVQPWEEVPQETGENAG